MNTSTDLRENLSKVVNFGLWSKKNVADFEQLVNLTQFLPVTAKIRQRAWHVINDVYNIQQCKESACANPVNWNDTHHRYQLCCSNKCSHTLGELNEKRKTTNLDRYGVDNIFKDRTKLVQAWNDSLGVSHPLHSPDVRQRRQNTNVEKYGVKHPWMNQEVRQQCVHTRYAKFEPIAPELSDKGTLNALYEQYTQREIAEQLGVAQSTVGLYLMHHDIAARKRRSSVERDVQAFLDTLGVAYQANTRAVISPHELDFYLPDQKCAIEVNGLWWHSERNGKHERYHVNKLERCSAKDIQLIQVWDIEWLQQPDIVQSRLRIKLGKGSQRIYARDCSIVELDRDQAAQFLNATHIQGSTTAAVRLGLVKSGELVACMTFNKPRFRSDVEYELIRFSSACNTNVVGGAARLFKAFVRMHNPTSIVSYSDRRWNTGAVYGRLGFTYSHTSKPNYFYFKSTDLSSLYSRHAFQKHKLHNIIETFDDTLSEWDNMKNNDYDRIWDCGNTVWIWTKK